MCNILLHLDRMLIFRKLNKRRLDTHRISSTNFLWPECDQVSERLLMPAAIIIFLFNFFLFFVMVIYLLELTYRKSVSPHKDFSFFITSILDSNCVDQVESGRAFNCLGYIASVVE